MNSYDVPPFLAELLHSRSPSGYEAEAQAVFDRNVKPSADLYANDALGNRIATLNPAGDPTLMLAGHMDEPGLIIIFISKLGYLFFDTIGSHNVSQIAGRRVIIQGPNGPVKGVTGKRVDRLMDEEERKKGLKKHEIWIDIGAQSRREALAWISIGDVATYSDEIELIRGSIATARAFNKVGAYIVGETLIRLAREKEKFAAKVVGVATAQEETGQRGAIASAYAVNPRFAIAVDVASATDHPDCDHRKHGETKLSGGPIICRGGNISSRIHERLTQGAKTLGIPYQVAAEARPTSTDARALQVNRGGVATGLVSVPLRYMDTPNEVMDLKDVEYCIRLLIEFARTLEVGTSALW